MTKCERRRSGSLVKVGFAAMLFALLPLVRPVTSSAATCGRCAHAAIPPGYSLDELRDLLSQERAATFSFTPYPPLGVYVHEAYIAQKNVTVPPDGSLAAAVKHALESIWTLWGGVGISVDFKLNGNDRPAPMPLQAPEKNKVVVVLDFVHGQGYVVAEASIFRVYVRLDAGFFTKTLFTKSQTMTANSFAANGIGALDDSWLLANWADPNVFRLRIHGLVAGPLNLEKTSGSAIDHQILIDRQTGEVFAFEGDTFPSVVTSQIRCDGSVVTRLVRTETNVNELGGNESFSYPQVPYNDPPVCKSPAPVGGKNLTPIASAHASQTYGHAPFTVEFDGTGSTAREGAIAKFAWSFGDHKTARAPVVRHIYTTPGTYLATLQVTDQAGRKATTGIGIEVLPPINRAPEVYGLSPDEGEVVTTNQPTLQIIAADPDGDPIQYQFQVHGEGVALDSGWITSPTWRVPPYKLDPATAYTWTYHVRDDHGHVTGPADVHFSVHWMPVASDMITTPDGRGYWTVDTQGIVTAFGNARSYGSLPNQGVHVQNVIGMARTADARGYWIVASDGGVFSFGDANFYGSMGGKHLNAPVVAMAPTIDGKGYWLGAADGGVFGFGNAHFYGSMGGQPLNAPVVGMAATKDSGGYWLVATDGGIFSFGDAHFYGSMGGKHLNAPVIDMVARPSGKGYWLAAEDGGVFGFGDAPFYGSLADKGLNGRITAIETTPNGGGYWLLGCDGGVFGFGNARFYGSNPHYACRGTQP